jgi:hypothetical protein
MTPEPAAKEFCPVFETTAEEVEREVAKYAHDCRLRPEEIEALAQRFIDCTDPAEKEELRSALFRGWYGGIRNA